MSIAPSGDVHLDLLSDTPASPDVTPRARRVVALAAKGAKFASTKDWLFKDEKGTWEREAARCIQNIAERATHLGMTEEQADAEIAKYLQVQAYTAEINLQERGGKRASKSKRA